VDNNYLKYTDWFLSGICYSIKKKRLRSKKANPVKTGDAKPWVYRTVHDRQAAEGLFAVKASNPALLSCLKE